MLPDLTSFSMPSVGKVFAWVLFGLFIMFMAVLVAFFIVLAPGLGILAAVLLTSLVILFGAYAWAKHIAGQNGILAMYVLLLWVWLINMPAIVAFDTSGITRMDLFNPQSIGRIALFFAVGLSFIINYFREPRTESSHHVIKVLLLPALIYGWFLVDAFIVLHGQDLLLALYRIAEWGLLFMLIGAVIALSPKQTLAQEAWLLRVVFAVLLFMLLITPVVLAISPSRAYFIGESGIGRLGNPFAHPNTLGVLAGMAFFYGMEHKPRFAKLVMFLSFGIMAATYSRGAWLGFALAIAFYLVLRPRTSVGRFFMVTALIFFSAFAWLTQSLYMDAVERLLARGQSVATLATASERTEVWKAARVLIERSPWLGHGFVAGPKKLGDIMATGRSASYLRAVHAHNEFVQTQIDGGVLATLLLAAFLIRTVYLLFALRNKASPQFMRCTIAWFIMLWSFGMLTPNISGQVLILGALLMYLYVILEWLHATRPAQRGVRSEPGSSPRLVMSQHSWP